MSGSPAASQNVFWPRTTKRSPSRRARVFSDAASDPASGSVTATDSRSEPSMMRGISSERCASVPWATSVRSPDEVRLKQATRSVLARPSSSETTISSSAPPEPQSGSDRPMPYQSIAAMLSNTSRGYSPA